jgi:hypothetical protein
MEIETMRRRRPVHPSSAGISENTWAITGQIVLQVVNTKFTITGSWVAIRSRSFTGCSSTSTSTTSGSA